jgi:Cu+-exporting ATPase
VSSVSVNLATERAHLEVLGRRSAALIAAVDKPATAPACRTATRPGTTPPAQRALAVGAALLLALPLVLPMLVQPFGLHWMLPAWAQFLLATPVQFISAHASTSPPGKPCAPGPATWTCWSPWAPAPVTA